MEKWRETVGLQTSHESRECMGSRRSPLPNPCKVPGNHEALYISMAGIHGRKALHDNDSFDEYWKKEVGYTWY